MKNNITLGSDPELMIYSKDEGRIVSSLRVFKGRDKTKPIQLGDGIRMYPDNVLLEAAFPPTSSIEGMMVMLRTVLVRMQERLGPRFQLVAKAANMYEAKELVSKKAREVGCNPSFNVYARRPNPIVQFNDGLRSGSFHLHVGYPGLDDIHEKDALVKLLDVFVGCASVVFDKDETSPLRRALYGRAGEFRPTPYGVEYRVLGNWALRCPAVTQLVWDLVAHACHHYEIGDARPIIEAVGSSRVQLAINNNDRKMAADVLEVAALPYKLMERVNKCYNNPDMHKAWGL
jgi:hypothetical protein